MDRIDITIPQNCTGDLKSQAQFSKFQISYGTINFGKCILKPPNPNLQCWTVGPIFTFGKFWDQNSKPTGSLIQNFKNCSGNLHRAKFEGILVDAWIPFSTNPVSNLHYGVWNYLAWFENRQGAYQTLLRGFGKCLLQKAQTWASLYFRPISDTLNTNSIFSCL